MELSISRPTEKFEQHLALEGNNRILFSGTFGVGKTYFLNKFFEEKKDKFLYIRLAPTNYAISSNEDIFDLPDGHGFGVVVRSRAWLRSKYNHGSAPGRAALLLPVFPRADRSPCGAVCRHRISMVV